MRGRDSSVLLRFLCRIWMNSYPSETRIPYGAMQMKRSRNYLPVAVVLLSAALLGSCSSDPEKAKLKYLAAGQSYMAKGLYGDAAIEFRNALRLDPRFVDAYYQLAQADLARHEWA